MLRLVEPPTAATHQALPRVLGVVDSLSVVELPRIETQGQAYEWGYTHGVEGLDLWTGEIPLDLADWARDGWGDGQRARDCRAEALTLDLSVTHIEGVATWAVLPDPAELAAGVRAIAAKITGTDPASEFARRALEGRAQDVELFEARTFHEVEAREWEMAETCFRCPLCDGGAR